MSFSTTNEQRMFTVRQRLHSVGADSIRLHLRSELERRESESAEYDRRFEADTIRPYEGGGI